MQGLIRRATAGVTRFFARPIDGYTLPFVVIKGHTSGPRVCITAGVHGSEYCAIAAAQRLLAISPSEISGTLVILPVVNVPSFWGRTIYTNPMDGKNLNRVFPGDTAGTASDRLAHWLVHEVFEQADAYIDLHCGDLNEALVPFTLFPEGDERARHLACVFGFQNAIASPATGMAISAAADRGVPAIIAEAGGEGSCDIDAIEALVAGVKRVLEELKCLQSGSLQAVSHDEVNVCGCKDIVAETDGLWYPACCVGDNIETGDVLGTINNLFGDEICSVTSPVAGRIMFQISSLVVKKGETVAGIGLAFLP